MFDQSNYGNSERILPRPLPASFADLDEVKNEEKDQQDNDSEAANNEVPSFFPFILDPLFFLANPQV